MEPQILKLPRAIANLQACAENEKLRPNLEGVHIRGKVAAATDSHILALSRLTNNDAELPGKFIKVGKAIGSKKESTYACEVEEERRLPDFKLLDVASPRHIELSIDAELLTTLAKALAGDIAPKCTTIELSIPLDSRGEYTNGPIAVMNSLNPDAVGLIMPCKKAKNIEPVSKWQELVKEV